MGGCGARVFVGVKGTTGWNWIDGLSDAAGLVSWELVF